MTLGCIHGMAKKSIKRNSASVQNRSLLAILFIGFLFTPFLGMQGWIQLRKTAVRKEVKHKLIAQVDKSELVLLKFTAQEAANQLEWEHSKEFEYRDEMYDVVSTETRGDTIYFWCWWDCEETNLNRQLVELTALALNRDPQHQNQKQRLVQFLQSLFVEEVPAYSFLQLEKMNINSIVVEHVFHSWKVDPPSPPPQLG